MAYETPAAFFSELESKVNADPAAQESLKEIGAVYVFELDGGDSAYTFDLNEVAISEGASDAADCTVKMSSESFLQMVNGEVQGQQLFMMGQLMIEGDMTLALRLEQVFAAAA